MKILQTKKIADHHTIYAKNNGKLLYKGSPVCHNFGNTHFYYASCVVNCVFDCDYCFLKGKYDNKDIVVYANLEDYFAATEEKLSHLHDGEQLYLCVSFDTDLFPLEGKLHYIERWSNFARKHNNLKVEVRTKAAQTDPVFWERISNNNMIFAFSLSPETIVQNFEHKTAPLSARLNTIYAAIQANANVRICLDPIIYYKDWERAYDKLIAQIFEQIQPDKIQDIAVGTFRISQNYLKKMREKYPHNTLAYYPFELIDGFYQYPEAIRQVLESSIISALQTYVKGNKIYCWKENSSILQKKALKKQSDLLQKFREWGATKNNKSAVKRVHAQQLIYDIRPSHTQTVQLQQLFHFAEIAKIDTSAILNYLYDTKILPAKSKKETASAIQILKTYLQQNFATDTGS